MPAVYHALLEIWPRTSIMLGFCCSSLDVGTEGKVSVSEVGEITSCTLLGRVEAVWFHFSSDSKAIPLLFVLHKEREPMAQNKNSCKYYIIRKSFHWYIML